MSLYQRVTPSQEGLLYPINGQQLGRALGPHKQVSCEANHVSSAELATSGDELSIDCLMDLTNQIHPFTYRWS